MRYLKKLTDSAPIELTIYISANVFTLSDEHFETFIKREMLKILQERALLVREQLTVSTEG